LSLGVIIMESKTPEKFEKLLPNDYWLLVPWRFYAWHPHHTSRDRSRFLRMMLFINNTKNTFYETKVLKTKHVSFLKYIYKLIMLYWFSTGHSDQCHWEIYRSNTRFTGRGPSDRCQFRPLTITKNHFVPYEFCTITISYHNLPFRTTKLQFRTICILHHNHFVPYVILLSSQFGNRITLWPFRTICDMEVNTLWPIPTI
jgi:hypothetical protein